MNLSPTQKKILTYGVPVVVMLGLYMWWRNRSSTTTTTGTAGTAAPGGVDTSTSAPIGLDQLSSFESTVGSQITTLGQQVAALQQAAASPAPPDATGTTVATAPNPTPAPVLPVPAAAPPPSPAPATPAPAPSPYVHILTPAEGSLLAAAGYNEFVNTPDGGFVQVTSGTTRLSTWGNIPPGSGLYYEPSQNPPPAPAQKKPA